MRPVITIALNSLRRSLKERETFIFGLAMPAVMMLLLGIAMGGSDNEPTITIDLINEDQSALAAQFVTLLRDEFETAGDDGFSACVYGACDATADVAPGDWRATADERMEDTDTFGAIIIEAGFGERLRAGDPVEVIFKNSADLSAPTLVEQKIDAAISQMNASVAIANLTTQIAAEEFGSLPDRGAVFESVRAQAQDAWALRPVRIEASSTTGGASAPTGFNQSGPGIAVMFVMIFMLNGATLLIAEREAGTLQRLYTLPVRKSLVLAGIILGHYLYGLAIFAVLVGVGTLFGVEWGSSAVGIALVMLIYTLATAALGLMLSTFVRSSAQASNIAIMMAMTLAPLGGAWWPLEIVPDLMRAIGHVSPIAWGMDAFGEMMFYGGGVADILPMLGALLGMAALFFGIGVFNFRYE